MEIINVPSLPDETPYEKDSVAIEIAFGALVSEKNGLNLNPVMGLMYLPTQELTRNFQQACQAILDSLRKS